MTTEQMIERVVLAAQAYEAGCRLGGKYQGAAWDRLVAAKSETLAYLASLTEKIDRLERRFVKIDALVTEVFADKIGSAIALDAIGDLCRPDPETGA